MRQSYVNYNSLLSNKDNHFLKRTIEMSLNFSVTISGVVTVSTVSLSGMYAAKCAINTS